MTRPFWSNDSTPFPVIDGRTDPLRGFVALVLFFLEQFILYPSINIKVYIHLTLYIGKS